ncbi:hypothetical protein GQ42DRAFT_40541 [Ramicandelaber brevisporus]|nr:hypothetical protein GQ42DRAFT_40541 [Ramicandelaber brevisporus]
MIHSTRESFERRSYAPGQQQPPGRSSTAGPVGAIQSSSSYSQLHRQSFSGGGGVADFPQRSLSYQSQSHHQHPQQHQRYSDDSPVEQQRRYQSDRAYIIHQRQQQQVHFYDEHGDATVGGGGGDGEDGYDDGDDGGVDVLGMDDQDAMFDEDGGFVEDDDRFQSSFYDRRNTASAPLQSRVNYMSPLTTTSTARAYAASVAGGTAPSSNLTTSATTTSATSAAAATTSTGRQQTTGGYSDSWEPQLNSMTLAQQEFMIVDDLLFILGGVDGTYIQTALPPHGKQQQQQQQQRPQDRYYVDPSLDSSLRPMVERILPLAVNCREIESFIAVYSRLDAGQVNQSLCAALRGIMHEFNVLLAQLEHQARVAAANVPAEDAPGQQRRLAAPFSLQRLWSHLNPTSIMMNSIVSLTRVIRAASVRTGIRRRNLGLLDESIGDYDSDDGFDNDDDLNGIDQIAAELRGFAEDGDDINNKNSNRNSNSNSNDDDDDDDEAGDYSDDNDDDDDDIENDNSRSRVKFDPNDDPLFRELNAHLGESTPAKLQNNEQRKRKNKNRAKNSVDSNNSNGANRPGCRGGRTLRVISRHMQLHSGDPNNKKLFGHLLNSASAPYMSQLSKWITTGEIDDAANDEFMIKQDRRIIASALSLSPKSSLPTPNSQPIDALTPMRNNSNGKSDSDNIVYPGADHDEQIESLRLRVRPSMAPLFLRPLIQKILRTGKYINVLRSCGRNINTYQSNNNNNNSNKNLNGDAALHALHTSGESLDAIRAMDGQLHVQSIESAYISASKSLLEMLLSEYNLVNHLRAMKRYFLYDQSDFLTQFLDVADDDLRKLDSAVPLTRLQHQLDLILRTPGSISAADPYKELLRVDYNKYSLVDQLRKLSSVTMTSPIMGPNTVNRHSTTGNNLDNFDHADGSARDNLTVIEALIFKFQVKFPVTLVLPNLALAKYQMLGRHLLQLRYLEQRLSQLWLQHAKGLQTLKKTVSRSAALHGTRPEDSATSQPAFAHFNLQVLSARSQVLKFVQQVLHYTSWEVIEPNWVRLEEQLSKATTADEMFDVNTNFIDTCLQESMLSNTKLMKIYPEILRKCNTFVKFTELLNRADHELLARIVDHFSVLPRSNDKEAIARWDKKYKELEAQTKRIAAMNNQMMIAPTKALQRIMDSFSKSVKTLVEALSFYSSSQTPRYSSLVMQLNYNEFYTNEAQQ